MNRFASLFLAGLLLSLAACQNDSPEQQLDEANETEVVDNNSAELEGEAIGDFIESEIMSPGTAKADDHGQEGRGGLCVSSVTFDTVRSPSSTVAKQIVITFNPSIVCRDGKRRSGQIVVTWFGWFRENTSAGRVVNVRTRNFFVNDNQIKHFRTKATVLEPGQPPVQNIVSNDTIVLSGGRGTITNRSERQRRWLQGFFTANPFDDVFLLVGNSQGSGRNNRSYSARITTPIRIERACRWPVSGVLEVIPNGRDARTLDYGTGTCDNLATLRVGNQSKVIQLP